MDNFIEYLDNYKTKPIDYNEIGNILNTIQYHFNENELYDERFTGIPYYNNYSKSLWNSINKDNNNYELWKKNHESLITITNKKVYNTSMVTIDDITCSFLNNIKDKISLC